MEIVVAQYRDGALPQCLDKPEYLQGLRTTVHQIASKPELVTCPIKVQTVEQCEQGGKTALHISNSINGHLCLFLVNVRVLTPPAVLWAASPVRFSIVRLES